MKKFKTESKRMLDLMINSIYTNREIFLRELISNASDAIDKLYYKALTEGLSGLTREDFYIRISVDKAERSISIEDNGIGMTQDELENNLGTIAKSGSLAFKEDAAKKEDIDIIGQFGVGFYSAFMVAKKVTVLSRAFGAEQAYIWSSEGAEGYDIAPAAKDGNGTIITLYLKDDVGEESFGEFLSDYKIKDLVKKYSDYIRYPIKMLCETYEYDECDCDECDHEHEHEHKEPKKVIKDQTLNSMIPIWKKQKSELKEHELEDYYKETYYDAKDPLKVITATVEGAVDYKALLFIPETIPFNYYSKNYEKGLSLYTSGVLITEKCAELLPDHFNFVKGVIDSELTLNISRETVQQNRQLKAIAQSLEKKIAKELADMLASEREKYEKFYDNFGLSLKYGVYSGWGVNADALKDLLMFKSAKTGKYTTFREYVDGMKEDQKYIFYATGATVDAIKSSPKADALLDKGYDLLCLTDDVDEFAVKILRKYDEKEFKSLENAADIGDEHVEIPADLAAAIGDILKDKIVKTVGSRSLKNHAVCLNSEGEMSIEMEKVLSAMPGNQGVKAQKVLELNVDHPVYSKLLALKDTDKEKFDKLVFVLFEQAKLISGLKIDDATALSDAIFDLIS